MMTDLTPGQRRRLHSWLLPDLLAEIKRQGFMYSLGAGFVDPGMTGSPHLEKGTHPRGEGEDINLFRCPHVPVHLEWTCPSPDWLQDTESHRPFGLFWKGLHPLCRWGGDFPKPDGGHYSLQDGVFA